MANDSRPTLDGVATAFAFGLASKKRADEHVANGVPVLWVSARMLVSAGEFVDRATTEGEQE